MFRYALLIVILFTFFSVYAQTELKSVEKCDFPFEEKNKIELPIEAIDCASPPEGYFLLCSNEELSKFYSAYPSSQSSCNTYQLPKFNFDTCKVLFYKISHWTGAQIQKQFYIQEGTPVFVLELRFRTREINSNVNYDSGYLLISKTYLGKELVVYTCHKEIN
jgi:hypothetical protein